MMGIIGNHIFKDISLIPGVGTRRRTAYARLMGERVVDALLHLPVNIEIREKLAFVDTPKKEKLSTIVLEILYHESSFSPKRPYRIIATDQKNEVELLFFNSRASFLKRLAPAGQKVVISGKISSKPHSVSGRWQIMHPDYIGPAANLMNWIGPECIYPLTTGINQSLARAAIDSALENISDLPEWIEQTRLEQKTWPTWREALIQAHAPKDQQDLLASHPARQRLAYDELLAHQLSLHLINNTVITSPSPALQSSGNLRKQLIEALPFSLTDSQKEALEEISQDMNQPRQMLRLLQGDVGSGKTLVAVLAGLQAIEAGYQASILAPTDILARQHFHTLKKFLSPLGLNVSLLTAREKGKVRQEILQQLADGQIHFLIGTHAIIQDGVNFNKLGLAIIDEQHRFGVEQRLALGQKGYNPHILSMTATPIPRTLMLANYGEMETSLLRYKPAGRQPIITRVLSVDKLDNVVSAVSRAIETQQKIYWVCPLIEESEKLDLAAVTERYEHLSALFPGKITLVHGRMKGPEKEAAMEAFSQGEAAVLIATTVIEVGVDVPEATIMIIEHAERFGLAQLHQLRGRVGRGSRESTCLLLYGQPLTLIARKRLETMRESDDGFFIAEADLKLRGGGELLGTKQSGLPRFKLLDLEDKDEKTTGLYADLLAMANSDARQICRLDPTLSSERGQALRLLLRLFKHEEAAKYKRSG